jgi:hypothetical protein
MNCGQRICLPRTPFWRRSTTSRALTSIASDQGSISMFFCDQPAKRRASSESPAALDTSSIRASNGLRQYLQWPEDSSQPPATPSSRLHREDLGNVRTGLAGQHRASCPVRPPGQLLPIVIPCRAKYLRLSRLHFVLGQILGFAKAQKRNPRATCRRQRSHKCSE